MKLEGDIAEKESKGAIDYTLSTLKSLGLETYETQPTLSSIQHLSLGTKTVRNMSSTTPLYVWPMLSRTQMFSHFPAEQ